MVKQFNKKMSHWIIINHFSLQLRDFHVINAMTKTLRRQKKINKVFYIPIFIVLYYFCSHIQCCHCYKFCGTAICDSCVNYRHVMPYDIHVKKHLLLR